MDCMRTVCYDDILRSKRCLAGIYTHWVPIRTSWGQVKIHALFFSPHGKGSYDNATPPNLLSRSGGRGEISRMHASRLSSRSRSMAAGLIFY